LTIKEENNIMSINIMNKAKIPYIVFSVFFLFIGGCIYIIFRDINKLIILEKIEMFEFTKNVYVKLKPSFLSNILIYNFPDMFWFVSGILLLRFIWFNKKKEQNIYILCFYLTGIIFEVSQLSSIIPGTFDYFDILFMSIGALVEGLLYKNCIKRSMK